MEDLTGPQRTMYEFIQQKNRTLSEITQTRGMQAKAAMKILNSLIKKELVRKVDSLFCDEIPLREQDIIDALTMFSQGGTIPQIARTAGHSKTNTESALQTLLEKGIVSVSFTIENKVRVQIFYLNETNLFNYYSQQQR